jgi:intein/homing endonuclease
MPSESKELAELMGIIFGDGGINNDWQLVITLNSIADLEYSKYVRRLLEKLFGIDVAVRKRPGRNALVLVCSSMNLIDYLVSKGAVRGNKIRQEIDTPNWIKGNPEFESAFVRGLVDTDGCLYIHQHSIKGVVYKNIGFCFTNFSKKLIISVSHILQKFDIKPYVTANGTRIYLYSQKSVLKYLSIFGSSNSRINNKYASWTKVNKNFQPVL